jgi:hypothetical protein
MGESAIGKGTSVQILRKNYGSVDTPGSMIEHVRPVGERSTNESGSDKEE